MLNTRLYLAASGLRQISSIEGFSTLYQGLWILPPQDEPSPIETEERDVAYETHLTDFDGGIMRTLGTIGEWITELPTTEERDVGYTSHFAETDGGIMRTLGTIGEWIPELPPPHRREQFPDFSYMDGVFDELI